MSESKRDAGSPKPFELLPCEDEPRGEHPVWHEQYMRKNLLTGCLYGTIEAVSPLHIATGTVELPDALGPFRDEPPPVVRDMVRTISRRADSGSSRYIPGSTFKGAVRGIVEAATASCMSRTRMKPRLENALRECTAPSRLCPACRIFGASNYRGRAIFLDAPLVEGEAVVISVPSPHAPRDTASLYETGGKVGSRKFYRHMTDTVRGAVPLDSCCAGSRFEMAVDFVNLKPEELGVILACMGAGQPPFEIKIGAGRQWGLGSAKVTINRLVLRNDLIESYTSWDADDKSILADQELKERVAQYLESAAVLFSEQQWSRLVTTLTSKMPPPMGRY